MKVVLKRQESVCDCSKIGNCPCAPAPICVEIASKTYGRIRFRYFFTAIAFIPMTGMSLANLFSKETTGSRIGWGISAGLDLVAIGLFCFRALQGNKTVKFLKEYKKYLELQKEKGIATECWNNETFQNFLNNTYNYAKQYSLNKVFPTIKNE